MCQISENKQGILQESKMVLKFVFFKSRNELFAQKIKHDQKILGAFLRLDNNRKVPETTAVGFILVESGPNHIKLSLNFSFFCDSCKVTFFPV